MRASDLSVLLTSFALVATAASILCFVYQRRIQFLIGSLLGVGAVFGFVWLGGRATAAQNYLGYLLDGCLELDPHVVLPLAIGAALGGGWISYAIAAASRREGSAPYASPRAARIAETLVLVLSFVGTALGMGIFLWNALFGLHPSPYELADERHFSLDVVATFDEEPVRVAVDHRTGAAYVSFNGSRETPGGEIFQVSFDHQGQPHPPRLVANSPVLFRPYGLAYLDGALFVSRSGFGGEASKGQIDYHALGAVTQIRDLDGDGYYEYYHDVLRGLPGARGPESLFQNNGIAFAGDGSLYITSAFPSNRDLPDHPLDGTVIRLSPDLQTSEVFARGFRNPFGIAVGPGDAVFVTDNDVEENPGDEVDHVIRGDHYGHPFYVPAEQGFVNGGFHDPIYRSQHFASNLTGIAVDRWGLLPSDCAMLITDRIQYEVLCLDLRAAGDTYRVAGSRRIARIPGALDVAIAPQGSVYVLSRSQKQLVRLRLTRAAPLQVAGSSAS
jgi:hypothetical protein